MKAITIHQPWCTLLALGVKTFETRSWSTHYRGSIALHAGSVRLPYYAFNELDGLLRELRIDLDALPYGAVIATATLREVYPADVVKLTTRERLLGHFSQDRYAWSFADIVRLDPPVPAKGARLLWNWSALDREPAREVQTAPEAVDVREARVP